MAYTRQFLACRRAAFGRTSVYTAWRWRAKIHLALARSSPSTTRWCARLRRARLRAGEDYAGGLDVAGQHLDLYIFAALTPVFNVASRHPVLAVPPVSLPTASPPGCRWWPVPTTTSRRSTSAPRRGRARPLGTTRRGAPASDRTDDRTTHRKKEADRCPKNPAGSLDCSRRRCARLHLALTACGAKPPAKNSRATTTKKVHRAHPEAELRPPATWSGRRIGRPRPWTRSRPSTTRRTPSTLCCATRCCARGRTKTLGPGIATYTAPSTTQYDFTLNSKAKFWDGSPVTAQDAVFSLDRAKDPKAGGYYAGRLQPRLLHRGHRHRHLHDQAQTARPVAARRALGDAG